MIRWRKPDSNRRRLSGSSEVVPTFRQLFSQYIEPAETHFWALANGVFSKGPKSGPKKGWLYANHVGSLRGRRNAAFVLVFPELLVFSRVSRTSVDVTGSHWKWGYGGTAGHRILGLSSCFLKYLVSQLFKMPPPLPPQSVGCHRKCMDVESTWDSPIAPQAIARRSSAFRRTTAP